MKRVSILRIVGLLLITASVSWAADEGAGAYKSKCAGCHGPGGEGKPAMKAPALKGTNLDANQIADRLAKGDPALKPPHNKAMKALTEEQAKAIAEYVKTLK